MISNNGSYYNMISYICSILLNKYNFQTFYIFKYEYINLGVESELGRGYTNSNSEIYFNIHNIVIINVSFFIS